MMAINIRQKGAGGEREICKIMNSIVDQVQFDKYGKEPAPKLEQVFQRNQNQTAVGGSDISNPFELSIEVKRQEALSINSWWKQTLVSAKQEGGLPILICKQNRKAWRVFMFQKLDSLNGRPMEELTRVEITMPDFKKWFYNYYVDFLCMKTGQRLKLTTIGDR